MKLDLKAIEERCEKATPGPWCMQYGFNSLAGPLFRVQNKDQTLIIIGLLEDDACFISNSIQDIPALLAFAKEAKEVLAIYSKYGDASKVAREVLAKWFGEGK